MSEYKNRAVVLKQRPQGEIQDGDLVMEERQVRTPNEGEVVAQILWLSLDPYMRPRMNDAKGYMDPIGIDEPIVGESVARVVESRSEKLKVGDLVTSRYFSSPKTVAICMAMLMSGLGRTWRMWTSASWTRASPRALTMI